MSHLTKTMQIKAVEADGSFEAVIATLNVVDHDGDLTVSGAFGKQHVSILPAHDARSVKLGKAIITEKDGKAIAKGRFNLEIQAAKEFHSALKFDLANGEPVQEWSYGFAIKDSEEETRDGETVRLLKSLTVFEVSPVLKGAGMGTGTVMAKDKGGETQIATDDGPWDMLENVRNLAGADEKGFDAVYFKDNGGNYHLPHHFVDADGVPGAASTRACLKAIAQLNGSGGHLKFSGGKQGPHENHAERGNAYDHMVAHLKAAGVEAPPLNPVGSQVTLKLADQVQFAAWDLEDAVLRASSVIKLRAEEGRAPGKEMQDKLVGLLDAMAMAKGKLQKLIQAKAGTMPTIEEILEAECLETESKIAGGDTQ